MMPLLWHVCNGLDHAVDETDGQDTSTDNGTYSLPCIACTGIQTTKTSTRHQRKGPKLNKDRLKVKIMTALTLNAHKLNKNCICLTEAQALTKYSTVAHRLFLLEFTEAE